MFSFLDNTDTIQIENKNLEDFIIDTFQDSKHLSENVKLLCECLVEWHDANILLGHNDPSYRSKFGF